jgi:photosynthetic reaction center cytochrome c subunit
MNSPSRRILLGATLALLVCACAAAPAAGQAAQAERPPMADDVFKNIQVLRGLTVDEFMGTMGFMSSSLSLNCSGCHDASDTASYALDNPRKNMARRMIVMVDTFNKMNFAGKREVTCYTCHRGDTRPKITPSLVEQYSAPPDDDPNEVVPSEEPLPNAISADQIFSRYIEALGGAQKLAALKSWVAQGTYEGFDTAHATVPVDIYAKAPNQRTTVVHLVGTGNNIRVFDGRNAWVNTTGTLMPIPVVPLTAGELAGAKLDAEISFPGQIKQLFSNWQANFPYTVIDDNRVDVVQATQPDNTPVRFYFDRESGLLVRQVRYTDTPIGLNPVQIDYSDYRDVAGVKFPFKLVWTWTDGQTIIELNEVRPNVTIEAARFSRPSGR